MQKLNRQVRRVQWDGIMIAASSELWTALVARSDETFGEQVISHFCPNHFQYVAAGF